MVTHRIKLEPRYFDRILSGQKTFEIRKNDRDYQVGDRLSMYPCYPKKDAGITWHHGGMESRNIEADVTYITSEFQQEGYCVLGIKLAKE